MKHIFFTIIFAFFIFAACAPVSTPTILPTIAATEISIPAIAPTQTPKPTPTLPAALNFFYPEIERVCPANREVSIKQLGAKSDSHLILTDLNQTGIWSFSLEDTAPKSISQLSPAEWISRPLSPKGNWIAHPVWNADSSSSIWILSLTTGEHREVLNIKHQDGLAPYVTWLSDQDLLVMNRCHTRLCHFPLRVVNIETNEYEEIEIDGDGRDGTFLTFFKHPSGKYALFSDNFDEDNYANFFVYDYAAARKVPVFPWLEQKVFPYLLSNIRFEFSQTSLAMFINQTYGFDAGIVENSMGSFTKAEAYDTTMKRVVFLYGIEYDLDQFSAYPIGLNSTNNSLLLAISYRYDPSILESTIATPTYPIRIENGFFSMNYQNIGENNSLTFKDYCFSMAQYSFHGVSSDGKIAVFESVTNDITLMNLENGKLARLPGWKFMGWMLNLK